MKKVFFGCLGATAAIFLIIAAIVWYIVAVEKPLLDASLSLDNEVVLGSTLPMTITATNTHEEPVVLDSIDLSDSLLEGFQVIAVEPKPENTVHLFGMRSWSFDIGVAPGESIEVRFELKAVKEGRFSGDVDVCNPNMDFHTLLADVVVVRE